MLMLFRITIFMQPELNFETNALALEYLNAIVKGLDRVQHIPVSTHHRTCIPFA